jgi:hypothetical protein
MTELDKQKTKLIEYLKNKYNLKEKYVIKSRPYPSGTVRTWSTGKKYKKLSSGKWMRLYEGFGDRGEILAVKKTIKKIQNVKSMAELIQIVKDNRERFLDKDGKPSKVMVELFSAARGTDAGKKEKKVIGEGCGEDKQKRKERSDKGETRKIDPEDYLNPNSENYAYKDTGYIPGNRKETAQSIIRRYKKDGKNVTVNDIDWGSIEDNPREAKQLITKSNVFGVVPWEELKKNGMDPGAGFLVSKVYLSVAKEPEDNPEKRKDFVYGVQSLREKMEKVKTVDDFTETLKEIKEEFDGTLLNAEQTKDVQDLQIKMNEVFDKEKEAKKIAHDKYLQTLPYERKMNDLKYEINKRERRKWKPDPELNKKYEEAKKEYEDADRKYKSWLNSNRDIVEHKIDLGGGRSSYGTKYLEEYFKLKFKKEEIINKQKKKNLLENPLTKAWLSLGDNFIKVLYFKKYGGSKSFSQHVATVRQGRVKDWEWLNTGTGSKKQATKESAKFEMKVAERHERKGGRDIKVNSTQELKDKFNLRDVQSGNWVLRDVSSAKFHTEKTAESFADMADILGIPDDKISFNGRLAVAFGARGKGSIGFAKGAPKAHYEPVQRVINMTKMGGGGSLAHEWFHALDNLLSETNGGISKDDTYVTTGKGDLKNKEISEAFGILSNQMTEGNVPIKEEIGYTNKDYLLAKQNIDRNISIAKMIKESKTMDEATLKLSEYFKNYTSKKGLKIRKDWLKIAVAHFDGNPSGNVVMADTGNRGSEYLREAQRLDYGSRQYYATPKEMAARAFQAYIEDKLTDKGQVNTYLVNMTDNKYHRDALLGIQWKPFPEGKEREKLNMTFDYIFKKIRENNIIEKALTNK